MSDGSTWPAFYAKIRQVAEVWLQDAASRRRVSEVDPAADAMVYCADGLKDVVEELREGHRYLTPEQYAALKGGGVTAQAVRNWIKSGELEAEKGPRGWLIPMSAERRRRRNAG